MPVRYRESIHAVPSRTTVRQIIRRLDVNPETVLVVRDGNLLTDDMVVEPSDDIVVVDVVSGG